MNRGTAEVKKKQDDPIASSRIANKHIVFDRQLKEIDHRSIQGTPTPDLNREHQSTIQGEGESDSFETSAGF